MTVATYKIMYIEIELGQTEDDWTSIYGVRPADLATAHRMLDVMLKKCAPTSPDWPYTGENGDLVLMPETTCGEPQATLRLDVISAVAIIAVAEVCAFLHCKLVPTDGGPEVAPTAEAIFADIMRRSIAAVRPAGKRSYRESLDIQHIID